MAAVLVAVVRCGDKRNSLRRAFSVGKSGPTRSCSRRAQSSFACGVEHAWEVVACCRGQELALQLTSKLLWADKRGGRVPWGLHCL